MLKNKYKRISIIMMTLCCLVNFMPSDSKVRAETSMPEEVTVTKVGGGVAIDNSGWVLYEEESAFGMFITDGGSRTSPVLCGDAFIPAPLHDFNLERVYGAYCTLVGSDYQGISEVTDNYIRKLMWYGWLGPAQWSGFSNSAYNYYIGSNKNVLELQGSPYANSTDVSAAAITQNALSHYRDNKQLHDPINARGVRAFISFLETASDDVPSYFHVYQLITRENRQDFFWYSYYPSGNLRLHKISSDSDLISGYSEIFSLENAVYEVRDSEGNMVGNLTTDASGNSNVLEELRVGTYHIREVSAPKGFKLDTDEHAIEITDGQTAVLEVSDDPELLETDILLKKVSDKDQPLKDVEFRVSHYRQLADSVSALKSAEPLRTWVFRTDEQGFIKPDDQHKVSGDALYISGKGKPVLLPGTYLFEETVTPEGYLPLEPFVRKIDYSRNEQGLSSYQYPIVRNDHEGYLRIIKKAGAEGMSDEYPLAGSQYTVYDDAQCKTVSKTTSGSQAVFTIGRDNRSEVLAFVPGTYYVKETRATRGWKLDEEVHEVTVEGWKTLEREYVNNHQTISIEVQKIDSETGRPVPQGLGEFAGAVYQVYKQPQLRGSSDDGQIILDENGRGRIDGLLPGTYVIREIKAPKGYKLSSESVTVRADLTGENENVFSYVVESTEEVTRVLVNKAAVDEKGEMVSLQGAVLQVEDEAGNVVVEKWTADGSPREIKGLEEGRTYYIRELEAPEGYMKTDERISFSLLDDIEITVTNEPRPEIHTIALFGNNLKVSPPIQTVVRDTVELKKLSVGTEYLLKGYLMDDDEVLVKGELIFRAEKETRTMGMLLEANGTEMAGRKLIVYEELYRNRDGEWELVSEHKDPDDQNQTVMFSSLKTTAADSTDEDKTLVNAPGQIIRDVIEYENVPCGQYQLETVLMDSSTGDVLKDENGHEYRKRETVEINETSGELETEIEVNGSLLEGKDITVFEYLYDHDKLAGKHDDIESESQTVSVPQVVTLASATLDEEKFSYVTEDIVEYRNLKADGNEYEVIASLIDRNTGRQMMNSEGKPITSSVKFTPEESDGTITVAVNGDGNDVRGSEVVVYEQINHNGQLYAVHNDINNEKQTVEFPDVRVSVLKTDENGKPLAGALLQIIDEEGTVIHQFTSGDDSHDISEHVLGGRKYVLHEAESPFGYEKAEDIEFTVTGTDDKPQVITMKDEKSTIYLKVIKKDSQDEELRLRDCEITVFRGDEEITRGVTDENGEILFELVYDEGYSFKETKAPQDYQPDDGKHEIVLPEDYSFNKESPIIITITDKKIPEVNTGDGSGLYLWYSLSAVSFGGVLGVLLVRRRKRK